MLRVFLTSVVLALATAMGFAQASLASAPSGAAPADLLAAADADYKQGNFDTAEKKYQQVLANNPKSAEAYAGLTRVYLRQQKVHDAYNAVSKGLQISDVATLHVALGEVYFRQGKIPDAEREWVTVINSGHFEPRAFLGVARVSNAISMYKRAKTMIDQAYQLDPNDPEIERYWAATLKPSDRIKYLQNYLSHQTNDPPETRARTQRDLDYLLAQAKQSERNCRLLGSKTSTQADLQRLREDANSIRGYALMVTVNGEKSKLMLDTGSSGILVDRRVAEKAGVTRLSATRIGGVGDTGDNSGYMAMARSIRIGGLEFRDCPVEVLDKRSVLGDDGLVGADIFEDFLVDIDLPEGKLGLKELPQRPNDLNRDISLKTEGSGADENTQESAPSTPEGSTPNAGPEDRYIAPEMKSYTPIYRFGHMLLVPTMVASSPPKLFLLDTGAFANSISPEAAREVTKIHGDSDIEVKGLSGSVSNVYTADKAILKFGHLRQRNEDIVAFDLSSISESVGAEISGTLGFNTLSLLDIKIDYRDGLVDFAYKESP